MMDVIIAQGPGQCQVFFNISKAVGVGAQMTRSMSSLFSLAITVLRSTQQIQLPLSEGNLEAGQAWRAYTGALNDR